MNELLNEFLVESYENMDQYEGSLIELEKDPTSKKLVSAIFRTLHTVKGTCGFLGLSRLEAIAHAGENLLSLVRDGVVSFNQAIASALLATGDAVRAILAQLEKTETEGDVDYSELVALLVSLQNPAAQGTSDVAESSNPSKAALVEAKAAPTEAKAAPAKAPVKVEPAAKAPATPANEPKPESKAVKAPVAATPETPAAKPQPTASTAKPSEGDAPSASKASDSTVRVNVELLDRLMNLVGELVLTRNQIVQLTGSLESVPMQAACHRLNHITTELQDRMMKTRVQPIDALWSKLPRTVRDLAQLCGKQIRLETEGAETELDRTVIEAIKDPMTHLLRNSVDHGVESPEERKAAGKNPEGRILLRAFHAAGLVTIEIIDDGGGIKVERVKARALERNLITPEKAATMSQQEVVNLIFQAGFSTAEKVSNISGRGVGMDVVKTQIEKIGGMVDMSTEVGKSTTCRIKIPLTLAIIPVVIVGCRGDRFAIPQTNLLEVIRLDKNLMVENVHETPVVRLRGNLLPIVFLDSVLAIKTGERHETQHLVVLQAGDRHFGLVVDTIHEAEEIVVKPLGRALTSVSCFAGATILGDGHVALILDIFGLGSRAAMFQSARTASTLEEEAKSQGTGTGTLLNELLVFHVGGIRAAMPLDMVSRLEEFGGEQIEEAAGRQVIQYGGSIMPLISLSRALGFDETKPTDGRVQTIVYARNGRAVGLVIDGVEEIVRGNIEVQPAGRRSGVLGSAVIGKQITELIDAQDLVRTHASDLFE
jgi:two-component system chemotaxis sensor kinase CheA